MKKLTTLITFLFFIILLSSPAKAQTGSITLNFFADLSTIDLATFNVSNGLAGAPRIMQVIIEPKGQTVYVEGVIQWKKDESSDYETIFWFVTNPFTARTFYNDELGNGDITIRDSNSPNSDLAKENLNRGKPSNSYIIGLKLFSQDGVLLDQQSKTLDFLNPAQTLSILSPQAESSQDVGSILVIWDGVLGASSYEVRANYRDSKSVSLEEALNSGNPIINDRNVGNVLSINARDYFERELLADKEIVIQVTAVVDGPGGGTRLSSNIINFYTKGAGTAAVTQEVDPEMTSLATFLTGYVSNDLIVKFMTGQIKAEDLEFSTGDGKSMTYSEFKNILSYLIANRNAINKITFTQN